MSETNLDYKHMKKTITVELYEPKSPLAKFRVGDKALVTYVHNDDSQRTRDRVGTVGTVLGRTKYDWTPGNRYYIQFEDWYIAGFESWLIENVS